MKNLLKTILLFALVSALQLVVWAQRPDFDGKRPDGPPPGVHGRITAINNDSIAVEMPDGTTQIVNVGKETTFARNRQQATLGDLKVGDFVGVMGPRNETGQVTAAHVFAGDRPLPPPRAGRGPGVDGPPFGNDGPRPTPENSVRGQITAINGNLITVQTPEGDAQVINAAQNTVFMRNREEAKLGDLKVGDFVGARGQRNAAGQFVPERVFATDTPRGGRGDGQGGPPNGNGRPNGGGRPDGVGGGRPPFGDGGFPGGGRVPGGTGGRSGGGRRP